MQSVFDEEVDRIKNNTQLVKYDTTPEIDTLEGEYQQNPSDELKQDITIKKNHCIKQFKHGVLVCEKLFQEKTLTRF